MPSVDIKTGEALAVLRTMPAESIDCVVTSPPYWRMRDYGHEDQLGLEDEVDEYIAKLATIFDEVRRVLVPTGSAWVNLGDGYARQGGGRAKGCDMGRRYLGTPSRRSRGIKQGDLVGVPWMFAFEARDRGWYLRAENIWHKPNPVPDSCASRPSRGHEQVFLLTKQPSPHYFYDADAVRTPLQAKTATAWGTERRDLGNDALGQVRSSKMANGKMRARMPKIGPDGRPMGAHRTTVWTVAASYGDRGRVAHYAVQSPEIPRICILAGCPAGGVVLDPFCGAGTTGLVAQRLGRSFVGIELVPHYSEIASKRIHNDGPMMSLFAAAEGDE